MKLNWKQTDAGLIGELESLPGTTLFLIEEAPVRGFTVKGATVPDKVEPIHTADLTQAKGTAELSMRRFLEKVGPTHKIGTAVYKNGTAEIFIRRLYDGDGIDLSIEGLPEERANRLAELVPSCVYFAARTEEVAEIADSLSRDQVSLLLYLETLEVDHSGAIDPRRMNNADFETLESFKEDGLLDWGRIAAEDLTESRSHWVELTSRAFSVATELRARRVKRGRENRNFSHASEK